MIRPIEAKDRAVFLELCREFYASEAVAHPIPLQYHEDTFTELLRSGDYIRCYLFETEGSAVGYALTAQTYSPEAGGIVVWIEELYLRPACRGQGLGTEFFRTLPTLVPPETARLRLEVEPDNADAIRLYERMGYTALPYGQMVRELRAERERKSKPAE